MIRRVLVGRTALLLIVLAILVFLVMFGRRVGLNELLIVGLIIGVILLGNGLVFLISQIVKGYRDG